MARTELDAHQEGTCDKELASKNRQIPAEPVGLKVARGEAEIGFQQMSELQSISGITIVGPIPNELQKITTFAAGVVTSRENPDAALSLIHFLASTAACPAIANGHRNRRYPEGANLFILKNG